MASTASAVLASAAPFSLFRLRSLTTDSDTKDSCSLLPGLVLLDLTFSMALLMAMASVRSLLSSCCHDEISPSLCWLRLMHQQLCTHCRAGWKPAAW